jgi:hypothetical protein
MKAILLLSLLAFASCSKDSKDTLPAPPIGTGTSSIVVNSATRICSGINCNQVQFNYTVNRPELLNSISFNYGVSVEVPVVATGSFKIFSTPSTVTGYFELKHKDGRIVRTETKSYL